MQVDRHLSLFWLVTGLLLIGCGEQGPAIYPTRGTVKFADGSLVKSGIVELSSRQHELTATGRIQPDGSFVLGTHTESDGACSGEHAAIVMQMIINDGLTIHTQDHGPAVDPRFFSYDTSNLSVVIEESDENQVQLVVRKKPQATH